MKILFAVIIVAILGAAVLFSVQNAGHVTIWFYNWQFTGPLAAVVFLSALAGAAITALSFLFVRFTGSLRRRAMKKRSKQEEERALSKPDIGRDSPR